MADHAFPMPPGGPDHPIYHGGYGSPDPCGETLESDGTRCQLPPNHDGAHFARRGASEITWTSQDPLEGAK